jgi:hypothetical protein
VTREVEPKNISNALGSLENANMPHCLKAKILIIILKPL